MHVEIIQVSGHQLATHEADIVRVYEEMYDLPTSSSSFGRTLREHAQRDGFRLCAAQNPDDGAWVGIAYGFTGLPGQTWRDALAAAVDQPTRDRWLTGYFEFAEFGVVPASRRQGIGGQLHDCLLADVSHPRSILTVRANNMVAKRFYEGRGWIPLYDGFFSPSGRGPYTIMGLTLRA